MKKVTIIGFGRFGKTLYELIKNDFDVTIYQRKKSNNDLPAITTDLKTVYESTVIFYAVPISEFEEVISSHRKYFRKDHLLIDVLSVKLHAKKVFDEFIPKGTQALLTHPMFGQESSKEGFEGLTIILDKYKSSTSNYMYWKEYFIAKKIKVRELSAEDHDNISSQSLGLTHFIGRILESYGMKESSIDSKGAKLLMKIKEHTCSDSLQLFKDLEQYNPYTKIMKIRFADSYKKISTQLLPIKIYKDKFTVGIQGGKGSFNEEAIMNYINKNSITNYLIKYLYTAEGTLRALESGEIDYGIMAIHNSTGGVVHETIDAMGKYDFRILEEFAIVISHALMIKKDAEFSDITTIMTHPQVFAQCKTNLLQKYPYLLQTSGKGELIDHALVAKKLSKGRLSKNIAVMGSKILAEIYDLNIVEDNLQDLKENYTSFLVVER